MQFGSIKKNSPFPPSIYPTPLSLFHSPLSIPLPLSLPISPTSLSLLSPSLAAHFSYLSLPFSVSLSLSPFSPSLSPSSRSLSSSLSTHLCFLLHPLYPSPPFSLLFRRGVPYLNTPFQKIIGGSSLSLANLTLPLFLDMQIFYLLSLARSKFSSGVCGDNPDHHLKVSCQTMFLNCSK